MDKRIKDTKQRLSDALILLLKNKGIFDINVKQLCDAAKINRTTFYKHYKDAFDLLTEMETNFISKIKLYLVDVDPRKITFVETLTMILKYIKENYTFAKLLIVNNVDKEFPNKLLKVNFVEKYIAGYENYSYDHDPHFLQLTQRFLTSGSYSIIRWWVDNGCELPQDVVANYLNDIIFKEKRLT